jgi:hypothetical protein
MPPILVNKKMSSPTVFEPAALSREARRQKHLAAVPVPEVCVLDPDGDIVRRLKEVGRARRDPSWPCYHTELCRFHERDIELESLVARLDPRSPCLLRSSCSHADVNF